MKKKIFIATLAIFVLSIAAFAGISFIKSKKAYTPQQNLEAPIEIPEEGVISWDDAIKANKPQVVLFYVDWCGFCRRFMPIFGEIAREYKDKYAFTVVNCDNPENKEIVEKFHIMGFPMVFVVDNDIQHRFILHPGATGDKEILKEELDNYVKARKIFLKKK